MRSTLRLLWRHKLTARLLALGLGVAVAAAIWHLVSASVPRLVRPPIGRVFYVYDEWLGSKLAANATDAVPEEYWPAKNTPVYQHTDAFGRRVTIQPPVDDSQSFVLFAPDSMLYGINVSDEYTIPSFFAQQVAGKKTNIYNYAVSGWGPGNMLALMTDPRFPPGIAEKRGFVVYSFNDNHIFRAACWPFLFKPDRSYRIPQYVVDAQNRVQRLGIISTEGEAKASLPHPEDAHSVRFKLFGDGIQWLIRAHEYYGLTARLIAEIDAEFKKRFTSQGTVVIFLPVCRHVKTMKALLEPMGIRCLDYTRLLTGPLGRSRQCGSEPCLQRDNGHPTVSGNRLIAERLAQDLTALNMLP